MFSSCPSICAYVYTCVLRTEGFQSTSSCFNYYYFCFLFPCWGFWFVDVQYTDR